ncbi:MAG: S4 domain-containing protein YaaA [Bacilli bacterium]|jgi:S4 domain protein YaaA|nr:S4 domain-containing protein YaaA [Bacilli bacterium]
MKNIKIKQEYITISQLLKFENFVSSGGEVKYYLLENDVLVNGISETRRGRKLYVNDIINVNDNLIKITNDF